ncbi:MAG: glycosyltransferase family 2 protein [Paracoccaceae bacterium]
MHADVSIQKLTGTTIGTAVCMAAVARDADGPVSVFISSNADINGVQPGPSITEIDRRSIGGAAVLTLAAQPGGEAEISVDGTTETVAVIYSKHGLFAGLNVGVALRNFETVSVARDWLEFHQKHHGMDGALIINRCGQDGFAQELALAAKSLGLKQLVISTPDFPIGHPNLQSEEHPHSAPDSPGKDRMKIPAPDPWRSQLGELSIYQLMNELYLGSARAVMNIDISDLIPPLDNSIFDMAIASDSGVVQLIGHHCYPWRVRKGDPPCFADHICVQFDSENVVRRWCMAPGNTGATATWRLVRITETMRAANTNIPFQRFMAIKHNTTEINKFVPKSSLVEDPELLKLSKQQFGHKPIRMPKLKFPKVDSTKNRTAIVTTMKNEGPFILEWIAYHRAIGINDFLVYTNDCSDGTDTLLKELQTAGIVQHRDNEFKDTDLKPQHWALQAANTEDMIRTSDWVICMDVDEFINVKVGTGMLTDLYSHMGDANLISCTWRLFGNSDVHHYSDEPIIKIFDNCAAEMTRKPHQAWGFKTLFRNIGIFKKLGVHRPKGLRAQHWDKITWVNGSGVPLPPKMYRNAWRSTKSTYGYDAVSLNHYAVRSAESFLVKRDRGRVNHVGRDQGLSYWFRMNNNTERETSIQRMLPKLKLELEHLKSNPKIAAAHRNCVAAHREKITSLRATENYAQFYDVLTSERMQRMSRMHAYFGANVFLAGPDVVPDNVVSETHPAGFFFNVDKQKTTH